MTTYHKNDHEPSVRSQVIRTTFGDKQATLKVANCGDMKQTQSVVEVVEVVVVVCSESYTLKDLWGGDKWRIRTSTEKGAGGSWVWLGCVLCLL